MIISEKILIWNPWLSVWIVLVKKKKRLDYDLGGTKHGLLVVRNGIARLEHYNQVAIVDHFADIIMSNYPRLLVITVSNLCAIGERCVNYKDN